MGRLGTSWIRTVAAVHLACMKTTTPPESGLTPLVSVEALAEYLGVPITTIYDWRTHGKGPCGIRVGKHVRFAIEDVMAWLDRQREREPGRRPKAG